MLMKYYADVKKITAFREVDRPRDAVPPVASLQATGVEILWMKLSLCCTLTAERGSASKSKGGCNKNEAPNWLSFHICPPTCWLLMSMNADSSNLERFEWWDLTVQSPHSSWNSQTKNALFAGEVRLVTIKSQNALLFLVELSPPIIRSIARFKDAKKWQKKRAVRYVIHLEAGNQKFDANHQILCFPEVPIGVSLFTWKFLDQNFATANCTYTRPLALSSGRRMQQIKTDERSVGRKSACARGHAK